MYRQILLVILSYIILVVILLPLLITALWGGFSKGTKTETPKETPEVIGAVDVFPSELEEYVVGVVAAEMPAAFPVEALKAQAVAARTYQVRKMEENGSQEVLYDVGQAYCTVEEQKVKWGDNYAIYGNKIRGAVGATAGEIMVYEGSPILAVFHAQSGGKTEAAENVWSKPLPYLKSVDSKGDEKAPQNTVEVVFSQEDAERKLATLGKIEEKGKKFTVEIVERSQAGYVQKVQAGGLSLTGKQVREALGLRSANFTVEKRGDTFVFITHGYGHGAGMSQYGASFLAEDGKNYKEILKHYYQDISFQNIA